MKGEKKMKMKNTYIHPILSRYGWINRQSIKCDSWYEQLWIWRMYTYPWLAKNLFTTFLSGWSSKSFFIHAYLLLHGMRVKKVTSKKSDMTKNTIIERKTSFWRIKNCEIRLTLLVRMFWTQLTSNVVNCWNWFLKWKIIKNGNTANWVNVINFFFL